MMTFYKRLKRSLKTRYLLIKDGLEVFFGTRHPLSPPKRYDYINIGTNEAIGKEFLQYFIDNVGLNPSHKVLEVGSGFGMAIPLTEYLSHEGHYNGIELIKDGVNWCQSNFTPKFPNFKFQRIDVFNDRYNPTGSSSASTYKFPFEDHSFDFVYLTSVFTHMYPDEIENYLKEISRVLKVGGHCFITYYLLNKISLAHITDNKGTYNFKYEIDYYRIENQTIPLYQIAFKERYIKDLYIKYKMQIIDPPFYGSWSGRQDFLSFQDIIIARK